MRPGIFDHEHRLAKLEKLGDPLPRLDSILHTMSAPNLPSRSVARRPAHPAETSRQ